MNLGNVKIGKLTAKDLQKIGKAQKAKLLTLKEKGYTKEQLYNKFPKIFVDKNY